MNDFSFLFYASKIFWFLVQPLNLVLFLLGFALLVGWFGWRKLRGLALLLAFLILALAFNLVGDALRDVLDPTQRGRD